MKELDGGKIAIYVVSIACVGVATPFIDKLSRTRGKNPIYHGIFFAVAFASLFLLPDYIQHEIFSPGGVLVIGTIVPVYTSIVAVCTPGEDDDSAWLQYWIASGTLSYCTEWIDEVRHVFPAGGEHWYEIEFFITLWMLLPLTDGAALIYDIFTEPYLAPICQKIKDKVEGTLSCCAPSK